MIQYKTKEEIELMRISAQLVSATLAEVAKVIKPGMRCLEIDKLAETFILDNGATPSFKNYNGFPATCCISVNEAVVHGIPNDYEIKDGDLISVDVGVFKNGFHGDSAYTFSVGEIPKSIEKLISATKKSLDIGVSKAIIGNRIGDIGYAIQEYLEKERGYGVVRELVGHGLGRSLHEDPQVPNYGKRGNGPLIKEGLVIAIEPMVNLGTREVAHLDDNWTVVTLDGKMSVHFEHTVSVGKGKPDLLSSFEPIMIAEKANSALTFVE
jgi:methionyl aminopeptidase